MANSSLINETAPMENLSKLSVLITAGPTREALDPVRYITNHSSGKMGYAIASAFLGKGYRVFLVSGPVNLELSHPDLHLIRVNSADEMYAACQALFATIQIAVFAAAVADYRPAHIHAEKIKKSDAEFDLRMVKNVDIAGEFGKVKGENQLSIGFALETNNEEQNALKKLSEKNFDLVVLNSTRDEGATFGVDTNKVTIIDRRGGRTAFSLKEKKEVAKDIAEAAIHLNVYSTI